jgi:hypothetical protein
MKIVTYGPSRVEPLGGVPGLELGSSEALTAPSRALAKAAEQIGVSVRDWEKVEDQIQAAKDTNDVSAFRFDALTRMTDRVRRLREGVTDEFGNVIEAPKTSREYLEAWKEAWRETVNEVSARATRPRVRVGLQRQLAQDAISQYRDASGTAFRLAQGEAHGTARELIHRYTLEAGLTDDPLKQQAAFTQLDKFLDDQRHLLGDDYVAHAKLEAREQVNVHIASRQIDADTYQPENWAGKIGLSQYTKLNQQWQHRVDQRDRQSREAWTRQKQATLGQLSLGFQNGTIGRADLPQYQESWHLTDHEVRAFEADIARYEKRQEPEDHAPTVAKWALRARHPEVTQADIDLLHNDFDVKKLLKVETMRAFENDMLGVIARREARERQDREAAERDQERTIQRAGIAAQREVAAQERQDRLLATKRAQDLTQAEKLITLDLPIDVVKDDPVTTATGQPGFRAMTRGLQAEAYRALYDAMERDPNLNPKLWWAENRLGFVRQHEVSAKEQVDVIKNGLPVRVEPGPKGYADAKAALDALRQKRQISDEQYTMSIDMLRNAQQIELHLGTRELHQKPPTQAQPGPAAVAPTRPTAPAPAPARRPAPTAPPAPGQRIGQPPTVRVPPIGRALPEETVTLPSLRGR